MVNTPPDSQNTSPKQFSRILKSSYKPSTVIPESSFYYPDTCYSFSLLYTAGSSHESSERSSLLDQQNQEWREHYTTKVRHQNHQLFKQYQDFCSGLKLSPMNFESSPSSRSSSRSRSRSNSSSSTGKVSKPKPPVLRSPQLKSSKLAGFVDSQLSKYKGLVNYPYAANYTYQSTGYLNDIDALTTRPELYKSAEGSATKFSNEPYKLPACPSVENIDSVSLRHPSVYQRPEPQLPQSQSPSRSQSQSQKLPSIVDQLAAHEAADAAVLQSQHQQQQQELLLQQPTVAPQPFTELVPSKEQFKTPPANIPARLNPRW
ncbi:unnamed protein product [Ambrosiozyma monospora]|uniref:Unnamed protein product n=1 Tax=Ambrosiozyma monospora TaxID=43982 RepID=A0ACB5TI57_AMBMO|nr:unnamed protein product [Ambrosiozyma monospora]